MVAAAAVAVVGHERSHERDEARKETGPQRQAELAPSPEQNDTRYEEQASKDRDGGGSLREKRRGTDHEEDWRCTGETEPEARTLRILELGAGFSGLAGLLMGVAALASGRAEAVHVCLTDGNQTCAECSGQ